jgi:glycosyltransferase involved in cell wall biosynthesis
MRDIVTTCNDEPVPIDISVLVTCYNEAEHVVDTIETLVEALRQTSLSYEIVVIDDVSTDNSVERVREYLRLHPSCPVVLKVNTSNQGLANNYVEGAFLGRGKYYHLACGDNGSPLQCLVDLYRMVGKADMIIPYQLQSEVAGKGIGRRWLSRLFTFLVNLLSGYNLRYYNGVAVHLRYNVMRWHPVSYGFGFQADITTMLLDHGFSYVQVYSRSVDRKGANSSALTMRNFLSVCHTLLEIGIRRIRKILYDRNCRKPVEIKIEEVQEPLLRGNHQ